MIKIVLNAEHLAAVLDEAVEKAKHRLFIATANVKNLYVPPPADKSPSRRTRRPSAKSILDVFDGLAKRTVEVRLLHSGIPSAPFLESLKESMPRTLTMRRCPRVHVKAVIVDGRWMYLGSANLTGAGLGAKSTRRRNFEAGIWTDQSPLIDPVADMLESIWEATLCADCGRKAHCPEPLEEPRL